MIRLGAAATGAIVVGGMIGGGETAMGTARAALTPPVAMATANVTIDDAPGGAALLRAPAATPVLAIAGGAVTLRRSDRVHVHGTGDDAGLDVDYAGVATVTPASTVHRGETVGQLPWSTAAVIIRVSLDGKPVDAGALLRAAMSDSPDGMSEWARPVEHAVVSQPFGCTSFSFEPIDHSCAGGHMHTGTDLAAARGTPVHAAIGGAAHVYLAATGYGLHVVVDDGEGLSTLYGHLDTVSVRDGDLVDAGDVIGEVGSTGNSTGPHLHFEVRRDGIPEDPTLDIALP